MGQNKSNKKTENNAPRKKKKKLIPTMFDEDFDKNTKTVPTPTEKKSIFLFEYFAASYIFLIYFSLVLFNYL